jgi:hypothetical protein
MSEQCAEFFSTLSISLHASVPNYGTKYNLFMGHQVAFVLKMQNMIFWVMAP